VDIGNSVERGFDTFFEWLPLLVGALLILVIGWIVAKVVGKLVGRVLQRAGLDRMLEKGQGGQLVSKVTSSPSNVLGTVVFWLIMLGTISLAVSVLGIEALTSFVAAVYAYLPNVLAALLIFLVASAVAAGIATLVTRVMGDTGLGKIVATVAPILVMTIATFMILEQLKIAHDIVITTYTLLLGAIALASALAFGLGGREVAGQMLQGAYQKGQENKQQFKQDLDTGMFRAKAEAKAKKDELQPNTEAEPVHTERLTAVDVPPERGP
jgi:Conserved TM helix